MLAPPAGFMALVEAIPAEEDAAFLAQAGERGRITSRAGSVAVGSTALTVAAIDKLNATIFPPDQLEALQQTGLAQFDFVLPGLEGTFTAVAGSSSGDRWLDIRRRSTAPPAPVRPVVEAPAAPQATNPFFDLDDLSSLDFPPRGVNSDLDPLTVPHDIFETGTSGVLPEPWGNQRHDADILEIAAADSAPGRTLFGLRRPARGWVRVAVAVGGGLAAVLLVAVYFRATPVSSADRTTASPPAAAARTAPPPVRPSPPAVDPPPSPSPTSTAASPQATSPTVPPPAASSSASAAQTPAPSATAARTSPTSAPVVPAPAPSATAARTSPTSAPVVPAPAPSATAARTSPTSAPVVPAPSSSAPASRTAPVSASPASTVRADGPSRSGFSVQVAAVRTRDEADRIMTRFVSQGYPVYLVRGEGAAASYHRVRIGPFADRGAAEKIAKQLEGTEGIKPWITKEIPESKAAAPQVSRREEPAVRH